MNSAKCNSCGAAIRWVRVTSSRTGKSSAMPVNADPDFHRGNIIVDEDGEAEVMSNAAANEIRRLNMKDGDPAATPMFLSHFATCPNSARHRTK
jgi:hypothetical protein